jgi:uncharacterized protein (UPF0335 family)
MNIENQIVTDNGIGAEDVASQFETGQSDVDLLINGAIRVLSLEYEIKMIREDIKSEKKSLKEEGLKVKDMNQAIKMLKLKYKPQEDSTDAEIICERLDKNEEVVNIVSNLVG